MPRPIFDGHNDVLLRLMRKGAADPERAFLDGDGEGHLDLPRMRAGGMLAGFFAIYVPDPGEHPDTDALMAAPSYDLPLPPPLDRTYAQAVTLRMAAILARIAQASSGAVRIARSAAEIRAALSAGVVCAVMHLEGAEGLDPDFHLLDVLHAAGLRSIGPVWSRPNAFGAGVPFRYPGDPDIGGGLTDLGRALVRRCNALRIMVDCSHLTERGFWDVAAITDAPLVATHSNAHALCPHSRNLTDRQLAAIRESGGVVGLNFATSFLRADGRKDAQTPLDDMVRHIDHLVGALGIEGVALGSDFDGATVPAAIGDAAGLPRLIEALARRGYDGDALERIACRNWLDVLERTWGA